MKDTKLNYSELIYLNADKYVSEASFLQNNTSKGCSEIFAINYTYHNSLLVKKYNPNFIIKITGRYFINEFETFLSKYILNNFDVLRQFNNETCEIIGCHSMLFDYIFNYNISANEYIHWLGHIEDIYNNRCKRLKNILICDKFNIKPTIKGGFGDLCYNL